MFASPKVQKVLLLQRNDKKVTLLLIYHISGFKKNILQNYIIVKRSFLKISSVHSITILRTKNEITL